MRPPRGASASRYANTVPRSSARHPRRPSPRSNPGLESISIALAALSCAVAVAACGGSSTKPAAASNAPPPLALAECMRSHGVPNFPDPTASPGGEGMTVVRSPGSSTLTIQGIPFGGPTFAAAQKTCKFFGGRRGRPQVSETKKLIQLHFAQCMRKHGVPNFPDPTFPTGGGISQVDMPGLNLNSPAVNQAGAVCSRT
jgi:hypothetical protein